MKPKKIDVKPILRALLFMEEHVNEELTLEEVSRIACYSPFHFHRLFHWIVGEPFQRYLNRIRLEKAAVKLRYSEESVTAIAMESGYETPSAFTRAFTQKMGRSPRSFREESKELGTMIEEKYGQLQPITPMRIETVGALELLSIRRTGNYHLSGHAAWEALHQWIEQKGVDKALLRYIGISHDDPSVTKEEQLRYDAAIVAPPSLSPEGEVHRKTLEGGLYALFHHHGSYELLDDTFHRIFLKWLPEENSYRFDETRPCFEEYFHIQFAKNAPEKLLTAIYIPIRTK